MKEAYFDTWDVTVSSRVSLLLCLVNSREQTSRSEDFLKAQAVEVTINRRVAVELRGYGGTQIRMSSSFLLEMKGGFEQKKCRGLKGKKNEKVFLVVRNKLFLVTSQSCLTTLK